MADYNRMQAYSSVATLPAGFLVLGITLLSSATGLFWWIAGLTLTILAGLLLASLALSYGAGSRTTQSAPILLANGTVAKITRRIPTASIVVIVVITLAVASLVYYLSPSAVSPKTELQAPTAKLSAPTPTIPEKLEPIHNDVKPIPHKAKPPVTKKDVLIKPKEIVPDKPIETAQIETTPIQPKEKLAAVLIRKYPATDSALERLPKGFIQEWLNVIHTVNDRMTKHDLQTVLRIRPRLRDHISDSSHLAEAIFTLRCLESEGYVRITETSDPIQGYPKVANNLEFEFVPEKLNEFMEGL